MRIELDIIQQWIRTGARVLDLGCGDGSLIRSLMDSRQVTAYGLEIDPLKINLCLEKGVNVIEQDLDQGLGNFQDNSFDTVVMTQTLQAVRFPHLVLDEMLRVGRECIITFPNFGNWRCRVHLTRRGRMPVSKFMPYTWYDTPNIHFCTIFDFEALCAEKNIHIINRIVVDERSHSTPLVRLLPNLLGATAIYHVTK
jgi:methionine biosynthesis protein MetW